MEVPFFIREMPLFFKFFSSFWILLFFSLIPLFFIYRFWFFLRNPKRRIPSGNNIVAPADGYVLYIKEIHDDKEVPVSVKKGQKIYLHELMDDHDTDYTLVIGIFMTPFSVHHNRIPFNGKIVKNHYRNTAANKTMLGTFMNLIFNLRPFTDDAEYLTENERNTLVIKNDIIDGAVVQIATKWVDLIKNDVVTPGEQVVKGDRFGMIRMGSQCDLFLNIKKGYKVVVSERQYVKAGSSILIELDDDD